VKTRVHWTLLAWAALLLAGCGKGTFPVEGIVTLDGKPVPGATVLLMPEAGNGRAASAFTDEEGNFCVTTYSDGDGALPGQYSIVVTRTQGIPEPPPMMQPGEEKKVIGHYRDFKNKDRKKSSLPAVYGSETTSPLKCQVPTQGRLMLELRTSR